MKTFLIFVISFLALLFSIYALHLILIKINIQPFYIAKKSELARMKKFINSKTNIHNKIATISFATSNDLMVESILIHEAVLVENQPCYRYEVGFSHWKYTGIFLDSRQEIAEYDWQIGKGKTIDKINFDVIPKHINQIRSENSNQKFLVLDINVNCIDSVTYNYSYIFENSRKVQLERQFTE